MKIDYETVIEIEIVGPDRSYRELPVTVGLRCITKSERPRFNGIDGGDPGWGAEFDIEHLAYEAENGDIITLKYNQATGLFGESIIEALIEQAETEARETGDF